MDIPTGYERIDRQILVYDDAGPIDVSYVVPDDGVVVIIDTYGATRPLIATPSPGADVSDPMFGSEYVLAAHPGSTIKVRLAGRMSLSPVAGNPAGVAGTFNDYFGGLLIAGGTNGGGDGGGYGPTVPVGTEPDPADRQQVFFPCSGGSGATEVWVDDVLAIVTAGEGGVGQYFVAYGSLFTNQSGFGQGPALGRALTPADYNILPATGPYEFMLDGTFTGALDAAAGGSAGPLFMGGGGGGQPSGSSGASIHQSGSFSALDEHGDPVTVLYDAWLAGGGSRGTDWHDPALAGLRPATIVADVSPAGNDFFDPTRPWRWGFAMAEIGVFRPIPPEPGHGGWSVGHIS